MVTEMISKLSNWLAANGNITLPCPEEVSLGPVYSNSWRLDPKHLLFVLSRYKFVGKMLRGDIDVIAEVGCCNGFASEIVADETKAVVHCYDIAPLEDFICQYDVMKSPLPNCYKAIYSLDLIEHIDNSYRFFRNLTQSLTPHGKLIIGCPSIEFQKYASRISKELHINCPSGEQLRDIASSFFHHVFMFSMNDEVVHTGFLPMACYLFAVCAEPKR